MTKKKEKTSRDHYNDWAKKLPKGAVVKTYFADDMFTAVVVPDFCFAYTYETKKKKNART